MSTSPRPWTIIASALLHIVIVALLLWGGFKAAAPPEQAPLALELWTTAPAPPAVAVEAPPVEKTAPPVVAAPPPPPAEVNLGHKKPEPKIEHKAPEPKPAPPKPEAKKLEPAKKEAPKKEPAKKEPVQAKPKEAPSAPAKHAAKPAKAYNPEADDLLASLDSTRSSGKGNARQDAAGSPNGVAGGAANGSSAAMGGWISRVRAKVTPLVQLPPDIAGNPKVVLQVTLLPSLEVNKVQLLQGSGSKAYDEAVQRAIWEAKTFPHLPAGAQFNDGYRQFKMEFRPRQ